MMNPRKAIASSLLTLVVLAIPAALATAQLASPHHGSILVIARQDTVTEGAVPAGDVEITVEFGNGSFTGWTDPDGRMVFDDLRPGRYELVFRRDGFSTIEYPAVDVEAGRTTTIEVELSKAMQEPELVSVCEIPERYAKYQSETILRRYAEACAATARGAWPSYPKILGAAREENWKLLADDDRFEGYRFIWIRSFDEPVVIKLERLPGAAPAVSVKIFDGPGSHDYGELGTIRQRLATIAELTELHELAADLEFWSRPPEVVRPGWMCLDGATWVIEGVRDGRYHYMSRHCPESDSAALPLGKHLMALSGEAFDPIY